MYTGCFRDSK